MLPSEHVMELYKILSGESSGPMRNKGDISANDDQYSGHYISEKQGLEEYQTE